MESNCCRFCGAPLIHSFVNLGNAPLSNAYLEEKQLSQAEKFYPLHAYVCADCFLVQLEQFETPSSIFSDYAYYSSFSSTWLKHAQQYVDMITKRLNLGADCQVIEIASNDGYLLQYFLDKRIPVLGIEPAANVAKNAITKGIPTLVEFFGHKLSVELSKNNKTADLIIANNVLAHVPDLNDFVAGIEVLLKPEGILTIEVPHLLELIRNNQFDTIYHEHFSYFSVMTIEKILIAHGLKLFDVQKLTTHGGSLRVYACRKEARKFNRQKAVAEVLEAETSYGLRDITTYKAFSKKVKKTKRSILSFLIDAKNSGKSLVGYGAPAKGNTLLNYCGIRNDFLDYTVDLSPHKQGRFLPGSHIPIFSPEKIMETKPDYIFILPWNLKREIMGQMEKIKTWGGKFVIPIPEIELI